MDFNGTLAGQTHAHTGKKGRGRCMQFHIWFDLPAHPKSKVVCVCECQYKKAIQKGFAGCWIRPSWLDPHVNITRREDHLIKSMLTTALLLSLSLCSLPLAHWEKFSRDHHHHLKGRVRRVLDSFQFEIQYAWKQFFALSLSLSFVREPSPFPSIDWVTHTRTHKQRPCEINTTEFVDPLNCVWVGVCVCVRLPLTQPPKWDWCWSVPDPIARAPSKITHKKTESLRKNFFWAPWNFWEVAMI